MSARSILCPAVGLIAVLALIPTVTRAENVGAAAAVRPSSTGTPPGGATRTLEIGASIAAQERIQTSESGSLQVMFVDKTTLTVGPNTDMLIDQFVYDSGGGTGQFTASLARGALRFVGGQISHTAGATITTPAATVGIRGGAALITHDSKCQASHNQTGNRSSDCTKVVCMGGTCTVKSRIDARNVQLHISQAVEIGAIGNIQPFSVSSVNLGTNTVTTVGATDTSSSSPSFSSQSTVDQTISEQSPEPQPPPSQTPGP